MNNIDVETINEIIGIKESYELPDKLMELLLSEERERVFNDFLKIDADLSYDWFTDYFQENHSNRNKMMQDYTPKELCELVSGLGCNSRTVKIADICCGTGGLTINAWNKNKDAFFYCEELSTRAFPLLLFNLAIRKMNAIAVNKNVLSGEVFGVYKINNGYIEKMDEIPEFDKFDLCITNPPYSVKHNFNDSIKYKYGIPPNGCADYGFVQYCLKIAEKVIAILPHGVLFRAGKEGAIRKNLILDKKIESVIGLPQKLFLNTSIPVAIITFSNDCEKILFVDASKEYKKVSKQNILSEDNIKKIKTVYQDYKEIEKYSHNAIIEEIEKNDYNLNIPRYVDTFEDETPIDINALITQMIDTEAEIAKTQKKLADLIGDMHGEDDALARLREVWR